MLFLEQTAPPSTSQTRVGSRETARLSWGISGDGQSFATSFKCSLSFSSASYLDRQCMNSGGMSECYINITRNKFVNDVDEIISHIRTACGNEIN